MTRKSSAALLKFKSALLLAVLSTFGFSVALAQQTGDVPVTATIKDYIDWTDPNSGTMQRIQMQVQSDGAGTYKNSKSVMSIIQGIGDWYLDTGVNIKNPTRKAFLDFSKPIVGTGPNGGNPTPPFTTALVEPKLISKLSEYGISMFSIAGGQTAIGPMTIGFYYPIGSTNHYRIHMTPDSRSLYPFPETDYVDITCTGVNASLQCNSWQIEPNGIKGGCVTADCSVKQNVVKLIKVVTVKGKETAVSLGDFLLSFSVELANP